MTSFQHVLGPFQQVLGPFQQVFGPFQQVFDEKIVWIWNGFFGDFCLESRIFHRGGADYKWNSPMHKYVGSLSLESVKTVRSMPPFNSV